MGLGRENDRGVSFDGTSYAAKSQSMYKLSIEGDNDVPTLSEMNRLRDPLCGQVGPTDREEADSRAIGGLRNTAVSLGSTRTCAIIGCKAANLKPPKEAALLASVTSSGGSRWKRSRCRCRGAAAGARGPRHGETPAHGGLEEAVKHAGREKKPPMGGATPGETRHSPGSPTWRAHWRKRKRSRGMARGGAGLGESCQPASKAGSGSRPHGWRPP